MSKPKYLLLMMCIMMHIPCGYADIIYVNPGESIQIALNRAVAGDDVVVHAGVYKERLQIPSSGTEEHRITLRSQSNETAIIDGNGTDGDLLLIENKSHVRVMNMEFRNSNNTSEGSGIRLLGACRGIELLSNVIHDIRGVHAMGITVYGTGSEPISNLLIRGNCIYDCEPAGSEALTLNGNITDFEVSSNIVHDVNNIGIDFIGGERSISTNGVCRNGICRGNRVNHARSSYGDGYAAGIYVDGGRNILVENNTVSECDMGIEIGAENSGIYTTGIIVRANLVYENDKAGIVFGGYRNQAGRTTGCIFENNLLWHNDAVSNQANGEMWIQWASNNVVRNNIIVSGSSRRLLQAESEGLNNTLDYNLWYDGAAASNGLYIWGDVSLSSFDSYRTASSQDAHSVSEDPEFRHPESAFFYFPEHSPAVNRGYPQSALYENQTDKDGRTRVQGGRIDVGPYEYPLDATPCVVATNDLLLCQTGSVICLAAPGILSNDGIASNQAPLFALMMSHVAHGTLNLMSDGSCSYAPAHGWAGEDSCTYLATEGFVSATGYVSIVTYVPGSFQLHAFALTNSVMVRWPSPRLSGISNVTVQLRYGTDTYPASTNDGHFLYQGTNTCFLHTNVNAGQTCYYTIWVHDAGGAFVSP